MVSVEGRILDARPLTIGRNLRGGERLAKIRSELDRFYAPWGPICGAAIEGASFGSVHREYDLGEASGAIKSWFYEHGAVEMQVVEPARLKIFATGNGQSDKKEVMKYVVQTLKFSVTGDDEADAAVLAYIAYSIGVKPRPATRDQAEVLRSLVQPPAKKQQRRRRPGGINI